MNDTFSTYTSPFSWRYGSAEMRTIFSEQNKYTLWRKIWVTLAQVQYEAGLVSQAELKDLQEQQNNVDIQRILDIEKETHHDVVAAIKEYAEKAKTGGGKIHLGATSMDVVDNTDALRLKEALELTEQKTKRCLQALMQLVEQYAGLPCIGYTHLQPAEPTTLGYRFAFYAQDLWTDLQFCQFAKTMIHGKGLKGAVGTSASYERLADHASQSIAGMEKRFMTLLGIDAWPVTNQVYPRKIDYIVLSALAGIAQTLNKFAFDLRFLQSPAIGELGEPFGKKQVGSSAMPFKRNPINSEKICSLARYISQLPRVALDNAGMSLLERTLDDSANRRIITPEAFLATDELLLTAEKMLTGLVVHQNRIRKNLDTYGPFAAIEVLLLEAAKKGANRQELHEYFRNVSLLAWQAIEETGINPLPDVLKKSEELTKFLSKKEIESCFDPNTHTGLAAKKCREIIKTIQANEK